MSILKLKDSQGNWISVPTLKGDKGNGIQSAVLNNDYTLTLTFTDGTTYKTPSIRGEKGEKGEPATDMDIHICSASEYDSETRIPTITSPDDKTFYLVPTEDGTSPDLFTEWVCVNNAWEMFGSASVDLSGYLTDVTVGGTSVVTDGVAEIPIGGINRLGVIQTSEGYGIKASNTGVLQTNQAISSEIKNANNKWKPIAPNTQHESTFYGLAKAAGHDEKDSTLSVGQYTDEAKASIQDMLDVPSKSDIPVVNVDDVQINGTSIVNNGVANVPIFSNKNYGVVIVDTAYGITKSTNGKLQTYAAPQGQIKDGTTYYRPIVPANQHAAVFYGLAKASGHDEKDSTLSVGQYTDEAKTAIKQMLGVHDAYDSFIVDVEGTDPTITGQPSYRYNCGEVLSLTVTPPETGTIDFRFTSGSSPTVLTLPSTVKMPEWWVEVEANTIYEMCITDGIYCGVMSWAM